MEDLDNEWNWSQETGKCPGEWRKDIVGPLADRSGGSESLSFGSVQVIFAKVLFKLQKRSKIAKFLSEHPLSYQPLSIPSLPTKRLCKVSRVLSLQEIVWGWV